MSFMRSPIDPEQREKELRARIAAQKPPAGMLQRRVTVGGSVQPVVKERPKLTLRNKVRQDIRDSARGEACTVCIPGICSGDPETTIWSHARWGVAGKGKGTKALDLCGAYCCTACDAVYDGQRKRPEGYTQWDIDRIWTLGHFRSLVRLAEKGLL